MEKTLQIACTMMILVTVTVNMTNAQVGTLGFFLNGVAYPNGSTVLRTDIGEGDNALQCTTDSTTCCRNGIGGEIRAGDFHFPVSDDTVPSMGGVTNGYYRDRLSRLIRLHRQPSGTITGRFRCNIPQSNGPSADLYINIAPLPPPTNLRAVTTTPTSITLTWEQSEGANAVDRYEINYHYFIEECESEGGRLFPPVTVSVTDGTLRRYTLNNSASTPVEEDSQFRITLTAINNAIRSVASQPVITTTAEAAPGLVQSLTASSVNITSITIRWDRVDCLERNGHTDGYRIVYYPTLSSNDRVAWVSIGTGDNDRMFSITGLPPRTNYTFEVQASNPNIDMHGPPAFYTASTTAPQGLGFLLDGQLYGNNSVVTVTDIGRTFFMSALFCLTPSLECCSDSETPNATSVTREWYLPDGRAVAFNNSPFVKNRVSSAVSLHIDRFSFYIAPSGMYHCEIPDASGTSQNVYVGIYPQEDGSPSITSLLFDRNSTTLTCTSTGGPPTTITWRKNGVPVDRFLYEQSQRLVDAVEATYQSVLFSDNVTDFVGNFTCEISNVRVADPVQDSLELNAQAVTCRASFNCAGGPGDDLGVAVDGAGCCLNNPNALAYSPLGSEECIPCIVVGFLNASFSGVEQGPGHSVPVGYLKGGTVAGQNLVFNVEDMPGTAREGSQFDYTVNTLRTRALANGQISNVVLTFRVDSIALEPNETLTLTLDPLVAPTPRTGLFFRNTITVTIIDSDNVEFAFTEDDFRANEPDVNGSSTFLPVLVSKSTRIASRVELVVVPLTIQEARNTSLPLPPNIPNDDIRSPPFASLNDFSNTNITIIFEPDEDAEINENSAPIFILGDAINEATEQVFVVELRLISKGSVATIDLSVRPSALCRIIDNDPIRIGFELPGYTYTEPSFDVVIDQFFFSTTGKPENGPIYLIKEDNVTSEQTFLVSIQVTDSAPSGTQSATFGQDYSVPTLIHSILFHSFEQRVPFVFTLLADAIPEGTEAFQASVTPEDTRDIGDGIMEQFPTSLNPVTLASEVFIVIDSVSLIVIGFATASYTVNESVGTFQVDVQVFNPADDQPLPAAISAVVQTIAGTATGGSDYREIRASFFDVFLFFDDSNRRQSFSVTIENDRLLEGTESFSLQLRFDPFFPLPNVLLSPDVSVVTIIDDDVPESTTVPPTIVPSTTVTLPPTTVPATTVPPPQPPPPLGVQGLCSFVVWYSPAVQSCEDIRGYEVRLYSTSPQSSHPNMTNRVGANRTFYMVVEEKLPNSHETYVQVRVIHQTSQVGEWSEGISLGCEKPTIIPEKPPRVHFELNGKVYLNNSALPLADIGEGTSALYCRTDKEECCGTVPNRFGHFYYPSGVQVPINARGQGFYRNRGSQLIRLNRREGTTSPTGTYRCEIPNADDDTVRIFITLTE